MTDHIDRRFFLTVSGASLAPLAFGCVSPPDATPQSRPKHRSGPAGDKIVIGAIGVGIRLRSLLKGRFLKDDRVRVVAVCDVVKDRREDAKAFVDKAYGNQDCKPYIDYRELLARDDIDAVAIGTPDHWHTTQVVHAAMAGKDIYCEKPLTHTLREGKVIMDAVNKHERVFQTGSQQRTEYGHKFVKAAEYVRNGRIGDVITVHVGVGDPARRCDLAGESLPEGTDWDRWLGPAADRAYNKILCPEGLHRHYPQWRAYWEFAGGGVADMGAHHFDIAQWALGMDDSGPIAVLPPARKGSKRGASLLYENGVTMVHGGPSGATFIGTQGMIHVDRGRIAATPANIFKKPIGDDELTLPRHKNHFDDWVSCIRSRKTPICSAEIGARSAAVCQLVNLAYRYNQKITWDPKAWNFASGEPSSWLDYDRRQPLPEG